MKRTLLLLCFSLIRLLHAEYSWERSSAEPLVWEGVDALYNYNFDKAISVAEKVMARRDIKLTKEYIEMLRTVHDITSIN